MNKIISHWEGLFDIAMDIVDKVQLLLPPNDPNEWTFGGGTAMMLQINHRNSFDVDFFSTDRQLLGYVYAVALDDYVNTEMAEYEGVGGTYIKLIFMDRGQVDFVTAKPILEDFARPTIIRGRDILMETVPEIIAKKVFHRGSIIVPRDLFDIAAACHAGYRDKIVDAFMDMPEQLGEFSETLGKIRARQKEYELFIETFAVYPGFEIIKTNALDFVEELVADTRNRLTREPNSNDSSEPKPPHPRM